MFDFTLVLMTTMSLVSKSLMALHLLCSFLCRILLTYTRMFSQYLCLNRGMDVASKLSKYLCLSEVNPIDLSGDMSIDNGNSLPISTTYIAMYFLSTGTVFHA